MTAAWVPPSGLTQGVPDVVVGVVGVLFVVAMVAIIGHRLWLEWRERKK